MNDSCTMLTPDQDRAVREMLGAPTKRQDEIRHLIAEATVALADAAAMVQMIERSQECRDVLVQQMQDVEDSVLDILRAIEGPDKP